MLLDRVNGRGLTRRIPYTITPFTFQKFHDTACSTIQDLTQALRYGTRKWVKPDFQNKSSLEREVEQSYFVPHGCDIEPLSHRRICDVLNQYSHVILVGNSLIRHLRQALFMALRRDFVLGGQLSDFTSGGPRVNPYQSCRCDGQFSEHRVCRQLNALFWDMTPRHLHVCSFLEDGDMPLFRLVTPLDPHQPSLLPWDEIRCDDPQYKGVFLLLSPILPFVVDNVDDFFLTYVNHPVMQNCSKVGKLQVVWMNFHIQSRQLELKYPQQSRENTTIRNQEIEQLLVERGYGHIPVLHMMNLTMDAQISDGYHYLSDVNLQKAYTRSS